MERKPASADVFLGENTAISGASAPASCEAMTPQFEKELVLRAVDGCEESFGRLYEYHRPSVQRHLVRLVGEDLAEDLTSLTFLNAYRALPGFQPREGVPFAAWLIRIAHNNGVSHLRSKKPVFSTEAVVQNDDGNTRVGLSLREKSSVVDPHTQAEIEEDFRMLKDALGELPEMQRDAIVLKFIHGLRYEEIAERLGVSVGYARVNVFRGRERLRRSLRNLNTLESTTEGAA